MDRILRINVSSSDGPSAVYEPLGKYTGLGGRALAAKVASEEIPVCCHPLGPENKLILAPGLLSGSSELSMDRLSVGCKSPLTGLMQVSNASAGAAGCMARLGIAAIILEGKPAARDVYLVHINDNEIRIEAENGLRMLTNYEVIEKIKPRYDDTVSIISIGTAGEMRMASSTIAFTDPELRPTRHAGRGGLGAVLGSKGIKAIILNPAGTSPRKPANPDLFQKAHDAFVSGLRKHPVTGEKRLTYGTNALNQTFAAALGTSLPGAQSGAFAGAAELGGPSVLSCEQSPDRQDIFSQSCHCGSSMDCSCLYPDLDNAQSASEAVWAQGESCGLTDADSAGTLAFLVDTYGFDSIEMAVSLCLAMEAGLIGYGDTEGVIRLVHEAGKGTPLGRIIGAGAASVAKAYGLKALPKICGLAKPLYETCVAHGAECPQSGGGQRALEQLVLDLVANLFKDGTLVGPFRTEAHTELPRNLNVATAALDSLGCCLFLAFAILDQPETFRAMAEMINGLCGMRLTPESILALGNMALKTEQEFNTRIGSGVHHDRLTQYVRHELLAPDRATGDDLDKEEKNVFHV